MPRAVAIWGAAGAVAGALGPTLGAAIVEGLGWRWAFFINLPVGIYTVIAGRAGQEDRLVPDPVGQLPRWDEHCGEHDRVGVQHP